LYDEASSFCKEYLQLRLAALFAALAGLASGQVTPRIEPDAEKLYHRSSTALYQLPAYEMDVETTLANLRGGSGEGFHILASIAARQPDQILVSGSTPYNGQTTVYSDGRTTLLWQESTNQFAKIDAPIPANMLMRLTDLAPESEPVEQTLVSARILRNEEIDLDGEKFDCEVIQVATTDRDGVKADPSLRTLWIDTKTGVVLRQKTDVVPPHLAIEVPADISVTRFHYGAHIDNGYFSFIVPADATEVDWHLMDLALTRRGLVGKLAPPLHMTTVNGRNLDLAKFRGKPVLLHFQTTWCKPCGEAGAVLDSVAKAMGSEVKILRVNVDESVDALRADMVKSPEKAGSVQTAHAPQSLMATAADVESLGLKAWPANMLIGRDGKILSFDAGRVNEAALLALLQNAVSPNAVPPPQVWGVAETQHGPRARSHEDVTPPKVIYEADPGYTLEAQKAKISGTVMLAILIGTDGLVSDIHVLEKLEPSLDARAITAVSKWRFKPAMRGTTPVAFRARAGVRFSEQ
jgi:TonB family protein